MVCIVLRVPYRFAGSLGQPLEQFARRTTTAVMVSIRFAAQTELVSRMSLNAVSGLETRIHVGYRLHYLDDTYC